MIISFITNANRFLGLVLLLTTFFITQGCGNKKSDANQHSDQEADSSSIEIIAHRGASHAKPENTMAAVNSAWQKNADAVEVDVYLTADQKVMVLHDETTGRTGDKDFAITETSSKKLRTVDVGSFKGQQFAGEKIPFLKEVVASVPGDKRLFIEIKDSPRIVPYIKDIIEQSGKKDQMVIISFSLDVVKASKEAMPDIPTYWLRSVRGDTYQPALLDTVRKYNLNGLDLRYQGVTKELVNAVHKAGYKLYVWTVDENEDMKKLHLIGVDGITTNRVTRAKKALR